MKKNEPTLHAKMSALPISVDFAGQNSETLPKLRKKASVQNKPKGVEQWLKNAKTTSVT